MYAKKNPKQMKKKPKKHTYTQKKVYQEKPRGKNKKEIGNRYRRGRRLVLSPHLVYSASYTMPLGY